jgi:hypothetical protein
VAGAAARKAGGAFESAVGKLPTAGQFAERKTLQSVGMSGDQIESMIAQHGEARVAQVANRLHEEGFIKAGESLASRTRRLESAVDDTSKTLAAVRKQADAAGVAAPNATEVAAQVRANVSKIRSALPSVDASEYKRLEKRLGDLDAIAATGKPATFEFWETIQREITKDAGKSDLFKVAAATVDDSVKASMRNASEDIAKQFTDNRARLVDLTTARDAAKAKVGSADESIFSTTDSLLGGVGAASSIVNALTAGSVNPLMAFAQSSVTGAAIGLASRAVRSHADVFMASAARKLQKFNERRSSAIQALLTDGPSRTATSKIPARHAFAIGSLAATKENGPKFSDSSPRG